LKKQHKKIFEGLSENKPTMEFLIDLNKQSILHQNQAFRPIVQSPSVHAIRCKVHKEDEEPYKEPIVRKLPLVKKQKSTDFNPDFLYSSVLSLKPDYLSSSFDEVYDRTSFDSP
jgi:hypothetical protein